MLVVAVVLLAFAVGVLATLVLTQDDGVDSPSLTVKEFFACSDLTGSAGDACVERLENLKREACSDPAVVAIDVTMRLGEAPEFTSTVLCSTVKNAD